METSIMYPLIIIINSILNECTKAWTNSIYSYKWYVLKMIYHIKKQKYVYTCH